MGRLRAHWVKAGRVREDLGGEEREEEVPRSRDGSGLGPVQEHKEAVVGRGPIVSYNLPG